MGYFRVNKGNIKLSEESQYGEITLEGGRGGPSAVILEVL